MKLRDFFVLFLFCSMVLPGTIQLSRFAVLPSLSWGGGALNVQASHQLNLDRRGFEPRDVYTLIT